MLENRSWFCNSCLFSLILVLIIACEPTEMMDLESAVATVEILPNDEPLIALTQEVQLEALARNSNGGETSNPLVSWGSSNPSVLSISNTGMLIGEAEGSATITAMIEGKSASIGIRVIDITGIWVGGEMPDTVCYEIVQSDQMVEGVFQSHLGFQPITDVKTGILSGSLNFSRYFHILELTTENDCAMRIEGAHTVEVQPDGSLIMIPGTGNLSSSNCLMSGTIDFATLTKQ